MHQLTLADFSVIKTFKENDSEVIKISFAVCVFCSGGEWYAGGKCDSDTEPLQDEKDLSPSLYPSIMGMLEDVLRWMKTPVYYLNVTIMSDFRKDGHPSIYRKPNMTDEERRTTIRYQDCSHWCLPGVPDTWNELLYAQLLMKHYQKQHKQQQQQIGS